MLSVSAVDEIQISLERPMRHLDSRFHCTDVRMSKIATVRFKKP